MFVESMKEASLSVDSQGGSITMPSIKVGYRNSTGSHEDKPRPKGTAPMRG